MRPSPLSVQVTSPPHWGQEAAELELPGTVKEVLLSNLPDVVLDGRQLWLKSCQAVVLQME